MARILVTGCAGFIGARTAKLALEKGYEVVGVDNMNDYYCPALKEHRLSELGQWKEFKFFLGDIENSDFVNEIFYQHQFESVIHLAARAGVRYSQVVPEAYFRTNSLGFLNILESMRRYKVGKVVLASTSSLYAGEKLPFLETSPVNRPISPYAASKKSAEMIGHTYHYLYGIDVTVCRYFTVYGPAGRPDMAPFRFIKWAMEGTPITVFGDGNQGRDFTYVDDIAFGTLLALKNVGFDIINLGGGKEPCTVNQVIRAVERFVGRQVTILHRPVEKTDMQETQANISHAEEILGWKPQVSLEDGLRAAVKWHMDNADLVRSVSVKI